MKAWLKKTWKVLTGVLVALVGVLTLGLIVKRQRSKLGRVRDKLAVEQARSQIQSLRARRSEAEMHSAKKEEEIAEIDLEIEVQRARVLNAHEGTETMTDDELEAEFRRLGL